MPGLVVSANARLYRCVVLAVPLSFASLHLSLSLPSFAVFAVFHSFTVFRFVLLCMRTGLARRLAARLRDRDSLFRRLLSGMLLILTPCCATRRPGFSGHVRADDITGAIRCVRGLGVDSAWLQCHLLSQTAVTWQIVDVTPCGPHSGMPNMLAGVTETVARIMDHGSRCT